MYYEQRAPIAQAGPIHQWSSWFHISLSVVKLQLKLYKNGTLYMLQTVVRAFYRTHQMLGCVYRKQMELKDVCETWFCVGGCLFQTHMILP